MAEELKGETWGEAFILRICERIRTTRRSQGYSVRELAERTAELGHPVSRQVLVNLEAGRRGALSIDDLFVIAHALAVNPLFLLFDQMQMGRPNEVLPGLVVPEWMALQWARSSATQISSGLYEMDFDGARGIIYSRSQLDLVRSKIGLLEREIEMMLEQGNADDALIAAKRAELSAHKEHESLLVSLLDGDGVQMNEAWYQPNSISHYRRETWAPDEGDDG